MLVCEATFARDGVLEYRLPDGRIRKEFRPPEENKKALTSFGLAPVTIEHPPVLVTEDNAAHYRKGISLQNITYGKGGFVRGEVALMDSEAIDYAANGGAEISAGYTCNIVEKPGVWEGQHYDCVQTDLKVNHLAITRRGRAGPHVRLHLDSTEEVAYQVSTQPKNTRMATIRIDSVDYEAPELLASVIGSKLKRLDSLEDESREQSEQIEALEEQVDTLTDERDRERGRADAQDICLTNAEIILENLGYRRDASGDYIRVDMKGKKHDMEYEDEDEDEMDEMDMEEEPMPKKKSKKKMDSADIRFDAKELMTAWKEADIITGQNLSEAHFDSAESPADVRRLVVKTLRPAIAEKLDSMSDATVDGIYDFLKEETSSRQDARPSYSGELNAVISAARSGGGRNPIDQASSARSEETSSNWQKPLSLSR